MLLRRVPCPEGVSCIIWSLGHLIFSALLHMWRVQICQQISLSCTSLLHYLVLSNCFSFPQSLSLNYLILSSWSFIRMLNPEGSKPSAFQASLEYSQPVTDLSFIQFLLSFIFDCWNLTLKMEYHVKSNTLEHCKYNSGKVWFFSS